MLGYDLSIAQMPIIEVMSCGSFLLKRPAMLVASLAFKESDELSLLTTNIFLKDLRSGNSLEMSCSISCLAAICTKTIADGVVDALIHQATHSKPVVRKKIALAMFKVSEKSPDLFAAVLPKLRDLLTDGDQTVQSAAVCSFLEIGKRNAKLLIPIIPILFHLLMEIKNNWIVIKLLRLMSFLCLAEPRLWTKLETSNVLVDLLKETKAKSVQVELSRFVVTCASEESHIVVRSFELLIEFLESGDANIRCIALNTLSQFLGRTKLSGSFPREALYHLVVRAADSGDRTIRAAALKNLGLLVESPETAVDTIQQLLALFTKFESKRSIQLEIINAVIGIGSHMHLIEDTEWYLRILILFGSDGCVDEFTSRRIVSQFKQLVVSRDATVVLPILTAAVRKDQVVSSIAGACAWGLGEVCLSHWSDQLKPLISILVRRVNRANSIEAQIDLIWGSVRIAAASNTVDCLLELEKELKLVQTTSSVALCEVVAISTGLVGWLKTGTAARTDIEKIVFEKITDEPIKVPEGLDQPFIDLPASLRIDPRSLAALDEADNEVYTDTEEEEATSAEPLKSTDLFSIESVLRR
jgi:vesicle coat complex subunit